MTNAREWVISEFDKRCNILTAELEARPYNELLATEGVAYGSGANGRIWPAMISAELPERWA